MKCKFGLINFAFLVFSLTFASATAHKDFSHPDVDQPSLPSPHPILNDLSVRKAIALCTNKLALIQSVYPLLSITERDQLVVNSFLPNDHWAYDSTMPIYTYDPVQASALLDAAGWMLSPGDTYRKKSGKELVLTASSTTSSFRQVWISAWENQLKGCGIHLLRNHIDSNTLFGDLTGLRVRDFELGAYAWYTPLDPGGRTLYSCDAIPSPENNWQGQNFSGWCNTIASDAIQEANSTLVRANRITAYHTVQQELGNDVPVIPLFLRVMTTGTAANLTGLVISPSEIYYTISGEDWQIPGNNTITVGLTQELWGLDRKFEQSFVTHLIMEMVNPRGYTTIGNDYQPVLLTQIPTLESGLANNSVVTVSTGDIVMDTLNFAQSLEPGVKVFDKDGNIVTFTGSPIQMNQLTVQYQFKPGIFWSDGHPLLKEDFQLGYKASCDVYTGRKLDCEWVKTIAFANDNSGYTVTWIPGNHSGTYVIPPFPWYPAHQIITSSGAYTGMKLAEVPISDWLFLPEVVEKPLGVGPYRIVDWQKGNQITLQAVSTYVNGNPLTQNIVFKFIALASTEQALIDGDVDVVGPESLPGLTNNLINAQTEGKIKLINAPTMTWEHVDLNFETYGISEDILPTSGGTLDYTGITGNNIHVTIPAGAVTSPITFELYPLVANTILLPEGFSSGQNAFRLTAAQNGVPITGEFPFSLPVQITVHYTSSNVKDVFSPSQNVYYWNGSAWEDARKTCPANQRFFAIDLTTQTITLNVCHLTEFATFGKVGYKSFLPLTIH